MFSYIIRDVDVNEDEKTKHTDTMSLMTDTTTETDKICSSPTDVTHRLNEDTMWCLICLGCCVCLLHSPFPR